MFTVSELKKKAAEFLQIGHAKKEGRPMLFVFFEKDGRDAMMACMLAVPPSQYRGIVSLLKKEHPSVYALIMMCEAWVSPGTDDGKRIMPKNHPDRRDVVMVTIEHPDEYAIAHCPVFEGKTPRLGELEWKKGEDLSGRLTRLLADA